MNRAELKQKLALESSELTFEEKISRIKILRDDDEYENMRKRPMDWSAKKEQLNINQGKILTHSNSIECELTLTFNLLNCS